MNHGTGSATAEAAASFLSRSIKVAAAASQTTAAVREGIIKEAFELHNLQTQTNSSLLEFGLNLGFIERRPTDGRLTIDSLNAFPMSSSKLVEQLLTELVLRLGIFIPATSLVKIAIEFNSNDPDREDALRCVYILSILLHQIVNYDETSMRTLNRVLMCVAIILFSLTTTNSNPCQNMEGFKKKMRKRLLIDYYLWCLMFAMNFALTCGSPLYINLEYAHGVEMHMFQLVLSTFCALNLCLSMRLIGYGRLAPLIHGTPLLFLDAGDGITLAKGSTLFLCYFFFWCSDWRDLVDWNHSMLCEAGICQLLNNEPGKLSAKVKKANHKFDEWRLEEGLDDDGWFILLDAPANLANGTTFRPHANESSSSSNNQNEPPDNNHVDVENEDEAERASEQTRTEEQETAAKEARRVDSEEGETGQEEEEEDEEVEDDAGQEEDVEQDDDDDDEQQMIDYSERVIYLQSRNPLLTSLAAIMLVVWK